MLARRLLTRPFVRSLRVPYTTRLYASPAAPPSTSRLARLESRLPTFLRHFTTPLRTAPVSHITAFLLLHELTAIIPLFGLAAFFHYTNWVPPYISEGVWVKEGTQKFGNWMRKRGWIGEEWKTNRRSMVWGTGEQGVRVVVDLATAWAVVKLLLPLRLGLSVWATPWFARWTVLPVMRSVRGLLRKRGVKAGGVASPAAGTGATGGGVLPKEGATKVK